MQESFTGIRVIKGYNLESVVVDEFQKAAHSITSFFMRAVRAGELPGPLIEFIGSIGVALVFAHYAFFAPKHAPAGDMLAFFFLVFSLYQPLKNLSRSTASTRAGQAVAGSRVSNCFPSKAACPSRPTPSRFRPRRRRSVSKT